MNGKYVSRENELLFETTLKVNLTFSSVSQFDFDFTGIMLV